MLTRSTGHRRRRGFGWIEVVVVLGILTAIAAILLPQIGSARETARGNKCRSHLRGLGIALFSYQTLHGFYPGYLNVLERTDKTVYVDLVTQTPEPVSWAVMILPQIDRGPLFEVWRRPQAKLDQPSEQFINPETVYIDHFLCPSDPHPSKKTSPLSFVANTGLPDGPVLSDDNLASAIPRDWAANGMFFDNYSEHRLVKPDPAKRAPMEYMRDERVIDPKSRTILLTENVDATSYVFDPKQSADGWRAAEIQTGCIWRLEAVDDSTKPPTMKPPGASLQINADVGKGDGTSFDYCRPSSRHPQSVNVAFVEVNVAPLRETISYYVYAKLMASDDENVALPGQPRDPTATDPYRGFRNYKLAEEDIYP